jgi:hypothetical protein
LFQSLSKSASVNAKCSLPPEPKQPKAKNHRSLLESIGDLSTRLSDGHSLSVRNYPRPKNNNNTFTWSSPSGVLDCTLKRPVGHGGGGACRERPCEKRVTRLRWSLEPAEFGWGKKPPRRKSYDSGPGRVALCNTRICRP